MVEEKAVQSEEKVARFRMEYGITALLTGWLVTFLVFCLGVSIYSGLLFSDGSFSLGLLPYALIYGLPAAIIVGLPLGWAIARMLQSVRSQWLHTLSFGVIVGAIFSLVAGLVYSPDMTQAVSLIGGWAAVSAAIGRASIIRMVARLN